MPGSFNISERINTLKLYGMYLRALVEGREGPGGKTLTIVNDFGYFLHCRSKISKTLTEMYFMALVEDQGSKRDRLAIDI